MEFFAPYDTNSVSLKYANISPFCCFLTFNVVPFTEQKYVIHYFLIYYFAFEILR